MKTVREKYLPRLNMPEISDGSQMEFKTPDGLTIANGYVRIVIGERGPYIEFTSDQIVHENIFVPNDQKKRLNNGIYYYDEYRSKDKSFVKLYFQKKTVKYADYKCGLWYVSPFDIVSNKKTLIKPLEKKNDKNCN